MIIYISGLCFCVAKLWTSVKWEFNDKVITRYSILRISWSRVKLRDDIKETKIIKTGGSPFGSRGFLLRVVFKHGVSEPLFSSATLAEVRTLQHQLEAYLTEGRR
jgi:hypothetical protein